MLKRILITLAALVLPLHAALAGTANVEQLLQASGYNQQVEQIPVMFKMGLSQDSQVPPQIKKVFIESVDSSYNATKFKSIVASRLQANMSNQDIDWVTAWYQTDTGRKILAAQEASSSPEAVMDMQANAGAIMANTKMMAFARRVDKMTGVTDMAMSIQEYTGIAMLSAMASSSQSNVDTDALKSMLSQQVQQMRPMVADQIAVQLAYAYRNLDAATLSDFETALKNPSFKKFNRAGLDGVSRGFEDFISDWTNTIAQSSVIQANNR